MDGSLPSPNRSLQPFPMITITDGFMNSQCCLPFDPLLIRMLQNLAEFDVFDFSVCCKVDFGCKLPGMVLADELAIKGRLCP